MIQNHEIINNEIIVYDDKEAFLTFESQYNIDELLLTENYIGD